MELKFKVVEGVRSLVPVDVDWPDGVHEAVSLAKITSVGGVPPSEFDAEALSMVSPLLRNLPRFKNDKASEAFHPDSCFVGADCE